MLVPTSSVLIVSEDEKSQSFNTIKIDFSKMSFINSAKDSYTQCPGCKSLLTIDDKKYISSKNTDSNGRFIWNCRFCKKQNKNSELYFVSSNFKHLLQKNHSTKIVPPIVLFLIDISGSMTSSIFTDLWNKSQDKNKHSSSLLTNKIKKIIDQSVMRKNEIQHLADLQKSFGNKNDKDQKFQHFSKLSFLFAIIQYHLKILKSKKQKSEFRIGFIFFSDSLTILKGAKQKSIPMYVHSTDSMEQSYPFKKQRIDFNNYNELFQKGKSYDRYFGDSRFSTFDVSKLSAQYIKTGGKTALGPALVVASGILSEHDQGSKIILVTDSLPNYGIFCSKQSSVYYKQISKILQDSKATLGVFRLINNEFQNSKSDIDFQNFIKSNQQNVMLIQISIKPSITEQVLQNAIKSLKNLINHQSLGHSYNLVILAQNQKITLNKFKYDNIDYRNLRFITSQSKHWIQVNIDKKQLKQNDMLFPVMTQLIIEYDDVFTKQKCLFMSYIIQPLIKPYAKKGLYQKSKNQIQDSGLQSGTQYLEQLNMENIQTLIDLKSMKKFELERYSQVFRKKTFRNELKDIIIRLPNNLQVRSIDCQSINDYTLLQNQVLTGKRYQKSQTKNISENQTSKPQNQSSQELQEETQFQKL